MKNTADIFCGVFFLLICAVAVWSVSSLPEASGVDYVGPGTLPKFAIAILALCSCYLILKGFMVKAPKKYLPEKKVFLKICMVLILFYLYLASVTYLGDYFLSMENPVFLYGGGFGISTALFLMIILPFLGRKNPVEVIAVSLVTTALLIVVFGMFFKVLLP